MNILSSPITQIKSHFKIKRNECSNVKETMENLGKANNFNSFDNYNAILNKASLGLSNNFAFTGKVVKDASELTERRKESIKKYAETFNLNESEVLNSYLNNQEIGWVTAKTAKANVDGIIEAFSKEQLNREEYLNVCLKQPQLFALSPKTIENNVRGLVEKFDKEGLTTENYLKACLKRAPLFCQSPETIENNVRGLVEKFDKEGLTTEGYLNACLKQPSLFYQSPETIESNVRDLVKKFDKEGLITENYLNACLKQPQLFYRSPETIENNVRGLVKKFDKESLTTEDYLISCLKQAPLFCQSPETIEDHIKALLFVHKNNLIDKKENFTKDELMEKVLEKPLYITCRNEHNYSFLLRKKMFPFGNPTGLSGNAKVNDKISAYLKAHPDEKFYFTIAEDDYGKAEEFIKYAKTLAQQATKKDDTFEIEIINSNDEKC